MLLGFEIENQMNHMLIGLRSDDIKSYIQADAEKRLKIVDAIYPLSRLSILVGPNSSGKTSLLRALSALQELCESEMLGMSEDNSKLLALGKKRKGENIKDSKDEEDYNQGEFRILCFFYLEEYKHIVSYELILELVDGNKADNSNNLNKNMSVIKENLVGYEIDEILDSLCRGKKRKKVKNLILHEIESEKSHSKDDSYSSSSPENILYEKTIAKQIFEISRDKNELNIHDNSSDKEIGIKLESTDDGSLLINFINESDLGNVFDKDFQIKLSSMLNELREQILRLSVDFSFDDEEEWNNLNDDDFRLICIKFKDFHYEDKKHLNILSKIKDAVAFVDEKKKYQKDSRIFATNNVDNLIKTRLDDLSDADKRAILILNRMATDEHRIIAIENPDINLYHENVSLLAELFCKIAIRENKQFLITSHYPSFLDHFSLKEIWNFGANVSCKSEENCHGVDRVPYCLAQDKLLVEMTKEGISISNLWYGQYF